SAAIIAGKFNISPDHTVWQGWDFGHNGAGTDTFGTSLFFQLANSGTVRATVSSYPANNLHIGQWSFVCATSDGSGTAAGLKIYVNGVLQSVGSSNDTLAGHSIVNTVPFTIGGGATNSASEGYQRFVGNINQVTLWNIALSQAQINALYSNHSPNDPRLNGPAGNLIGY